MTTERGKEPPGFSRTCSTVPRLSNKKLMTDYDKPVKFPSF
jgi:hypothetical protein